MKTRLVRIVLIGMLGQLLVVSGCYNCAVSLRKAMTECKVEKSVRADFASGAKLVIGDCDGTINVAAGDVNDCCATATVFVHAPTKREARAIGEQVRIAAEPDDGMLVITVEKPPMPPENRFVSVDLDVLVPRRAHIDCQTEFGRVKLAGIEGNVRVATGFGAITCEDVRGSLDLQTQWGRIVCREIVSDRVVARAQKGSIDISCADACPAEIVADVSTEWGKVRFKAPPKYQGTLELESELGSVKLDTPAKVRGTIEDTIMHDKVSGRIGSGKGSLRLFTNLGSVALR